MFWRETLPSIGALALRSEELLPYHESSPLRYLPPDAAGAGGYQTVALSREHVASALALAWFDAIGPPALAAANLEEWEFSPGGLSFRNWLEHGAAPCDAQKALCLVHYFRRVRLGDALDGVVAISRFSVRDAAAPERADAWRTCTASLSHLAVVAPPAGIDGARGALQADFANEYIGGGVLCAGDVQEEIRFATSPECMLAILVCPRMRPHEAIRIDGVRCYAAHRGYSESFACVGPAAEEAAPSSLPGESVVAFDAPPLVGVAGRAAQYSEEMMLRNLRKLRAALGDENSDERQPLKPFATGNWGAGAFGGDPSLNALLQWCAASRAGRDVVYFPFGDPRVEGLRETAELLRAAHATVGQLSEALFACGEALSDERAFAVIGARFGGDVGHAAT